MNRPLAAVGAALALLVGVAVPADARVVPATRMVVVDADGWVTFSGDVAATTASEHQDAQVELVIPVRGVRGPLVYRWAASGPAVWVHGRYPSAWAVRGSQRWVLVDVVDERRTTVRVEVVRSGGR